MIVISPYAAKLPSENPKNYPFWKELIALMPDEHWVQVGIEGETVARTCKASRYVCKL